MNDLPNETVKNPEPDGVAFGCPRGHVSKPWKHQPTLSGPRQSYRRQAINPLWAPRSGYWAGSSCSRRSSFSSSSTVPC